MSALETISPSASRDKRAILEYLTKKVVGIPFWKKRECVLQGDRIFIISKDETKYILLKGAKVSEDFGLSKQHCFHIAVDNGVFLFAAPSKEVLDEWVGAIRDVIHISGGEDPKHITNREPDIPENQLKLTDVNLGRGGCGIVKKGIWLNTVEVAVKTINNIPEFIDKQELDLFYKEIEILSKLRHPNIVQLYGFCKKGEVVCLITQYISGGNLETVIRNSAITLSIATITEIAKNICKGMIYLHSKKVVHRDLKSANILVESLENGSVKVCDFGLAKQLSIFNNSSMSANVYGTPAYQAPELSSPKHTHKVDVFSFAVILWELTSRQVPWSHVPVALDVITRAVKGERPPLSTANPFRELIMKAWGQEPTKRPEFSEIYEILESVKPSSPPSPKDRPSSPDPKNKKMPVMGLRGSVDHNQVSPRVGRASGIYNTGFLSSSWHSESDANYNVVPNQYTMIPVNEEESIQDLFRNIFKNQVTTNWESFASELNKFFGKQIAPKVKYTLENSGVVNKDTALQLLSWMSALKSTKPHDIWNQIFEVMGKLSFHGFLNLQAARHLLLPATEGKYLIRFSSKPGSFALSVKHGSDVFHCRIDCSLKSENTLCFSIVNKQYSSLEQIIQIHSREPLGVLETTDAVLLLGALNRKVENSYALVTN